MQKWHPMDNELSKEEFSVKFLGRRHKAAIWSAILEYHVEPPEPFYATSIYRQIVQETGARLSPGNVAREIEDFANIGMIERVEAPGLSESAKAYQCVPSSPGWLMISGTVEAFDSLYPEQ